MIILRAIRWVLEVFGLGLLEELAFAVWRALVELVEAVRLAFA